MKEIKAIIQTFRLDEVLTALQEIGDLPGCTVSEVRGYGKNPSDADKAEWTWQATGRTKLEIVVPDTLADTVVETIRRAAHTGHKGDGKIYVLKVADLVSIRTGHRGESAI